MQPKNERGLHVRQNRRSRRERERESYSFGDSLKQHSSYFFLRAKRTLPALLLSFLALTFCLPTFYARTANAETDTSLSIETSALTGEFYNAANLDEFIPTLFNNTDALIDNATFTVRVPSIPNTEASPKALIEVVPDASVLKEKESKAEAGIITTTYTVLPSLKTQQNTAPVFKTLRAADGMSVEEITSLPDSVEISYSTEGLSLSKGVLPKTSDSANFIAPFLLVVGATLVLGFYAKQKQEIKGAAHAKQHNASFFAFLAGLSLLSAGVLCTLPVLAKAQSTPTDTETVNLTVNKEIETATFAPDGALWTDDASSEPRSVRTVYNGTIESAPGTVERLGSATNTGWNIEGTEEAFEIDTTRLTANITLVPRFEGEPFVETDVVFILSNPATSAGQGTCTYTDASGNVQTLAAGESVELARYASPSEVPASITALRATPATGFFFDGYTYTAQNATGKTNHYLSCKASCTLTNHPDQEQTDPQKSWQDATIYTISPNFVANKTVASPDTDFWLAPGKEIWKEGATPAAEGVASGSYEANGVYTAPEDGVVRTMAEIKQDKQALQAGDEETLERYMSYMMTDEYHLYAKYTNSAGFTGDNAYIEARIINVGTHPYFTYKGEQNAAFAQTNFEEKASDGSVLTFQSCYVLPTAYAINSTATDTDRIFVGPIVSPATTPNYTTDLYTSLQAGGIINGFYPQSLKDTITPVVKTCIGTPTTNQRYPGGSEADTKLSSVSTNVTETLWLPSIPELAGPYTENVFQEAGQNWTFANNEGPQYQFYAGRATVMGDSSGTNPILANKGTTRAAATVASGRWWERSAYLITFNGRAGYFCYVYSDGYVDGIVGGIASILRGVALCFCF